MKRVVLIVCLALMLWHACAEFDAEIVNDSNGSTELVYRLINDGEETITAFTVYINGTAAFDVTKEIAPGGICEGKHTVTLPKDAKSVSVTVSTILKSTQVEIPVKTEGILKLYAHFTEKVLREGDTAHLVITAANAGQSAVRGITVKADGFESEEFDLSANAYRDFEVNVPVHFPLTASAEAYIDGVQSAKATAEGKELTEDLTVSFVSETEIKAGDTCRVTVNIENKGSTSYSSPILTESCFGQIEGMPGIIAADSFTTINAVLPPMHESRELSFTFEGMAEDGKVSRFDSPKVTVTVNGDSAAPFYQVLKPSDSKREDLADEVLISVLRLNGLYSAILYACAGAAVITVFIMIVKASRRRKKR